MNKSQNKFNACSPKNMSTLLSKQQILKLRQSNNQNKSNKNQNHSIKKQHIEIQIVSPQFQGQKVKTSKMNRYKSNNASSQNIQNPRIYNITSNAMIFLFYRKHKISINFQINTPFKEVIRRIYEQIATYERIQRKLTKQQIKKELQKLIGFSSLDYDINFDYRFSIQNGELKNTKFLKIFQMSKTKRQKKMYQIYYCLAIGGFSKVYLGRSYQNGKFYAMKFLKKLRKKSEQDLHLIDEKFETIFNEIQIAKQMKHSNIINLHHAFQTKHFYCIVFQYCPGGQLFYHLKKIKCMTETDAKFYFKQILAAIGQMHKKNIIYRDLKPQNILINHDGHVKLVDFGLSKEVNKKKTYSYCGSAQYMAPQMIMRTGHSYPLDYYSLGTLLYELVTGLPPFYTKNIDELQRSIICEQVSFPSFISDELKDLLTKLLQKDQRYRLGSIAGLKQIMVHPWMGKSKPSQIELSPFVPNIQLHNFDEQQLGNDQQQFTKMVYQDMIQLKDKTFGKIYQQYYKQILSQQRNSCIDDAISAIQCKQLVQNRKKQINTISSYLTQKTKNDLSLKLKKYRHSGHIVSSNFKIRQHKSSQHKTNKLLRDSQVIYNTVHDQLVKNNKPKTVTHNKKIKLSPNLDTLENYKINKLQKKSSNYIKKIDQQEKKTFFSVKKKINLNKTSENHNIQISNTPQQQTQQRYLPKNTGQEVVNQLKTNKSYDELLKYVHKLPKPYIQSSLSYIKSTLQQRSKISPRKKPTSKQNHKISNSQQKLMNNVNININININNQNNPKLTKKSLAGINYKINNNAIIDEVQKQNEIDLGTN